MLKGEEKYLLALNRHPQIGAVKLRMLFQKFQSWTKIWRSSESQLLRAGIEPRIVKALTECRNEYHPDKEVYLVDKYQLKVTTYLDEDYPARLTTVTDAPAVLYYRGTLDCLDAPTVAIVGTRKISSYGRDVTEKITIPLTRAGVTIVSGFALGIDSVAHATAINEGQPTAAVLANGLDKIYPSSNLGLAHAVVKHNGVIVSEYAPGIPPLKYHFPMRNRIVAGLSDLTVVVEGAITSGALITAKLALEYNRDVGAIPGDINSLRSEGPNYLIQNGALVVTRADDVLSWLGIESDIATNHVLNINEDEAIIYQIIASGPSSVDKLVNVSKMSIAKTNSILGSLELKGLIRQCRGDTYIKL